VASLRRVQSPRVAEVLDADPWGETPYVATRYVPGLSLHQHLRAEGPVTGGDLRYLATGLLEALTAVHRVGVLHRDVKPSNVLLEGRAPVLIDFGLARLAEDSRLTHTGWLLGTPGYLAPEILYGDDASPASDVHAWAATLVFAATGRPPYGTGPAMAVMDRVRRGEHDLSGVPDDLLPMLRDCLAPEPAQRPSTGQLLQGLGAAAGAAGAAAAEELATMPFAVTAARRDGPDGAATEVVGDDAATTVTPVQDPDADAPTQEITTAGGPPPVLTPAREPYVAPPPPQAGYAREVLPPQQPAAQVPPPPVPFAGLRRRVLLLGLGVLVVVGFARAPYLDTILVGLGALTVRTLSWSTESARERRELRGRPAWYDGLLTALTTPWYLVVATAGTLVLLGVAAGLALLTGAVYMLFRPPVVPGLLTMGAVLTLAVWWGPGSRRLRRPLRRAAGALTRRSAPGWVALGVVAAALAFCAMTLSAASVDWSPMQGAPWRFGTPLGDLLRWL
jgi:hypothetical protein